jgi:hypothetical protein
MNDLGKIIAFICWWLVTLGFIILILGALPASCSRSTLSYKGTGELEYHYRGTLIKNE